MAKSTTKKNHDASWSDLTYDMLFVIMMKVDAVDFLAFSRVCKSWRSVALSNKNKFLVSRPPMSIWIRHAFWEDSFYLKDCNGRKIKRTLRHCGRRKLVGLTCGYLIFYGRENRDFWLVNPITNHELHFPGFPSRLDDAPRRVRGILVFSPSMSGWVFVMAPRYSYDIWFFIAGKGAWNHITYDDFIMDIHAFKGKIYTITGFNGVCELRLKSWPKVTLLKTKNIPYIDFKGREIVSFGENLYVIGHNIQNKHTVLELDTGEMKWVQPKNKTGYDYLVGVLKRGDYVFKQSDCDRLPQYPVYAYFHDKNRKDGLFKMWYYTHDCMDVDIIYT